MQAATETIVAIATAQGRGGVGIVRISGPLAGQIAVAVSGRQLKARHAHYGPFLDAGGQVIDEGLSLYFPGPNSFTGEDVLELQGHGGPVVLDLLVQRCLELGARQARPGEFSERAFLNDKLDLAQAEAIADLIEASSEQAARNALRSLQGEFSRRVHALTEQLISCASMSKPPSTSPRKKSTSSPMAMYWGFWKKYAQSYPQCSAKLPKAPCCATA